MSRPMPELVYEAADEHGPSSVSAWVAQHIEYPRANFDSDPAIGVISEGKLIAGAVYSNWQQDYATLEFSMAAVNPMWARPEVIRELLAYPFFQLDVFKLWTLTPVDNVQAIRMNMRVGFTQEAVLAHQFGPNRHGVVCRLLQPEFVKRYEAH